MANFRAKGKAATPSPLVRPRPAGNSSFVAFSERDGGFCAYVHRDVLERIEAHARQGERNEVIGLLAGRICQDLQRAPYTLVMAAEGAVGGEVTAGPGSVHISPEGRARVSHRLIDSHPDREIVGWYHSHPHGSPNFSPPDIKEQAGWTDPGHVGIVFSGTQHNDAFGVYRGPDAVRLSRLPQSQAARATRNIVIKDAAPKAPPQPHARERERVAAVTKEPPAAGARALPAAAREIPAAGATAQTVEVASTRGAPAPSASRFFVLLAALAVFVTLVWMHTRMSAVELAQRTAQAAGGNTAAPAAPSAATASTSSTASTSPAAAEAHVTPRPTPPEEHSSHPAEALTPAAGLPPVADAPAVAVPANPIRPERDNAAPRVSRDDLGARRNGNGRTRGRTKAAEDAKARQAAKKAAPKAPAKPKETTGGDSTDKTERRQQNTNSTPAANSRERLASPKPTPGR